MKLAEVKKATGVELIDELAAAGVYQEGSDDIDGLRCDVAAQVISRDGLDCVRETQARVELLGERKIIDLLSLHPSHWIEAVIVDGIEFPVEHGQTEREGLPPLSLVTVPALGAKIMLGRLAPH